MSQMVITVRVLVYLKMYDPFNPSVSLLPTLEELRAAVDPQLNAPSAPAAD
jgi:hypothetical protein